MVIEFWQWVGGLDVALQEPNKLVGLEFGHGNGMFVVVHCLQILCMGEFGIHFCMYYIEVCCEVGSSKDC